MTMPIYILLKQLITCQEDTQSFRTIAIIFLYIHSMPPPSITMVTIWKDSAKPSFDHSTPMWICELIMAVHSQSYLKERKWKWSQRAALPGLPKHTPSCMCARSPLPRPLHQAWGLLLRPATKRGQSFLCWHVLLPVVRGWWVWGVRDRPSDYRKALQVSRRWDQLDLVPRKC